MLGPPDTSAQLVKIGQTKSICAVDDDRVGVWNIEPALDNCRADEHVDFPADKSRHDSLKFIRIHLTVSDFDFGLRTKIDNTIVRALDRHYSVMQKENLALPFQFSIDRIANNSLIIAGDDRFDRQTIEWRGLNSGHVFHADEREIQRARDWRGGERQDIDELKKIFEFFLMQDAKALLLIDHDETEIFKYDVSGDEPVRADHDVDTAFPQ